MNDLLAVEEDWEEFASVDSGGPSGAVPCDNGCGETTQAGFYHSRADRWLCHPCFYRLEPAGTVRYLKRDRSWRKPRPSTKR